MITALMAALVSDACGFRLTLSADGTKIRISPGRVPPFLKEMLLANKTDLLLILEHPKAAAATSWLSTQGEIAKRWEIHAKAARDRGEAPANLDDESFRAEVRVAIERARDFESLAAALGAVEEWRGQWLTAMGGIPAVGGGDFVEL